MPKEGLGAAKAGAAGELYGASCCVLPPDLIPTLPWANCSVLPLVPGNLPTQLSGLCGQGRLFLLEAGSHYTTKSSLELMLGPDSAILLQLPSGIRGVSHYGQRSHFSS